MTSEGQRFGTGTERVLREPAAGCPRVETMVVGDLAFVRCLGEFDASGCDELAGALDRIVAGAASQVLVDVSGTDFLDCHALALIVSALHRLNARGASLRLAVRGGQPGRLLGLTQVDETVETVRAGSSRAQAG